MPQITIGAKENGQPSHKEQLKGDVSKRGRSASLARPLACSLAISCLEQVQRRGE